MANAAHNVLQEKVYDFLCKRYGPGKVQLEKHGVDITLNTEGEVTLFEIKPFQSTRQCVREALGQLLQYSFQTGARRKRDVKLAIVGPSAPNAEDNEFVRYIKKSMLVPVTYMDFASNKLTKH